MTGLPEYKLKNILSVCENYNTGKVWLFGSRARGNHRYNSDIDIAVDYEISPAFHLELEDAAGLLKIDIVEIPLVDNDILLEEIQRDGILIHDGSKTPS